MGDPVTIVEDNLSVAWAKAFLLTMEAGEIAPLIVVIKVPNDGLPDEVQAIRRALDDELAKAAHGLSCQMVANTIFPQSLWNPQAGRQELYKRYLKILPRILKDPHNRYGVYFERLIAFGHDNAFRGGVNQLEHIIQTWLNGNHRRTALLASVFDPTRDHTNQRQRGFPCLQQVAFARQGKSGLALTGLYATQYIFQRAYGNYLGLYRLGRFMAQEMELDLIQVTCIASPAVRDNSKISLQKLAAKIRTVLGQV